MKNSVMKFAFNKVSDDITEISIEDEIAKEQSVDWWTGEKRNEVTAKNFKKEIDNVTTNNIVILMNSGGGDVFTANSIISYINEAMDKGKKVTCRIMGVCASAAVGIARTCENVKIENGAYMMIHNPMAFLYGFCDSSELQKQVGFLDKIKEGIIDIYDKKTKCSRDEISRMMDEETWMTAKEAVEYGFADEVIHEKEEEVNNYFKGAVFNCINEIPEAIKNALNKEEKGAGEMEIKTIDDLKKAYPEMVAQIETEARNGVDVQTAVNAERERLKAIDQLAGKVNPEVLNKAKYESSDTAEKVAFDAMMNGGLIHTEVINGMAGEDVNIPSTGNLGAGEVIDTKAADLEAIKNAANRVLKAKGRKEN